MSSGNFPYFDWLTSIKGENKCTHRQTYWLMGEDRQCVGQNARARSMAPALELSIMCKTEGSNENNLLICIFLSRWNPENLYDPVLRPLPRVHVRVRARAWACCLAARWGSSKPNFDERANQPTKEASKSAENQLRRSWPWLPQRERASERGREAERRARRRRWPEGPTRSGGSVRGGAHSDIVFFQSQTLQFSIQSPTRGSSKDDDSIMNPPLPPDVRFNVSFSSVTFDDDEVTCLATSTIMFVSEWVCVFFKKPRQGGKPRNNAQTETLVRSLRTLAKFFRLEPWQNAARLELFGTQEEWRNRGGRGLDSGLGHELHSGDCDWLRSLPHQSHWRRDDAPTRRAVLQLYTL